MRSALGQVESGVPSALDQQGCGSHSAPLPGDVPVALDSPAEIQAQPRVEAAATFPDVNVDAPLEARREGDIRLGAILAAQVTFGEALRQERIADAAGIRDGFAISDAPFHVAPHRPAHQIDLEDSTEENDADPQAHAEGAAEVRDGGGGRKLRYNLRFHLRRRLYRKERWQGISVESVPRTNLGTRGSGAPDPDGPTSRNQIQTCRRQLATYSRISKRTTFWNGVLFRRLQVRRTRHRDYSRHCRFLLYPQQLLMPQNQLRKLYQVGAFLTRLRGMRRGISSLIPELNP